MPGTRAWWVVSAALAIMVLPGLAVPASAASFSWTLTCKIGQDGGSASATWEWLQDGQVIAGAGGSAGCFESGGGDRPADANGLAVTLTATAGAKRVDRSATESFDPSGGFASTLRASAHDNDHWCGWIMHTRVCFDYHWSISAKFTMTG